MNAGDAPLEVWGGVECTVNRVGDRWFDQMAWAGHDRRVEDLDRIAALGVRALRYPVLWERLAPRRPGAIDWRGAGGGVPRAAPPPPGALRLGVEGRASRAAARSRRPSDCRAAASRQRPRLHVAPRSGLPPAAGDVRPGGGSPVSVGPGLHAGQRAADHRTLQWPVRAL